MTTQQAIETIAENVLYNVYEEDSEIRVIDSYVNDIYLEVERLIKQRIGDIVNAEEAKATKLIKELNERNR